MCKITGKLSSCKIMKFEPQIEKFFIGLPHLPKGWSKWLASITPYTAFIGAVLSALGGLSNLGGSGYGWLSEFMPFVPNISPIYFYLTAAISFATAFLLFTAYKPLKAKSLDGWLHLFYSNLLGIVQTILTILMAYGSLISSVIGAFIGVYVLYEIKPYFKKKASEKKAE